MYDEFVIKMQSLGYILKDGNSSRERSRDKFCESDTTANSCVLLFTCITCSPIYQNYVDILNCLRISLPFS